MRPEYIVPAAGARGMTALHEAAYYNDPGAVRQLLEAGESVDARDDAGWTPLHWSIDMSQAWGEPEEVVALLLAAGASPSAIDRAGYSVLMRACGRNNLAILNQLLSAGADLGDRSAGSSPLHEAACSGFTLGVTRLLELGADPAEVDAKGDTAEDWARRAGFDETLAVLVAARRA